MSDDDQTGDYEVGYGKPPKHSQWKKGQSGSPGGRKRRPNAVKDVLRDQIYQPVTLSDGRKSRVVDLIVARGIKEIAEGKVKQWVQAFAFLQQFDPKVDFVPTTGDQERLQALLAKLAGTGGSGGPNEPK